MMMKIAGKEVAAIMLSLLIICEASIANYVFDSQR